MQSGNKLEQLEQVMLAPFALQGETLHPGGWGARCVLELEYASNLCGVFPQTWDRLVADAVDTAWSAWKREGAITRRTTEAVEAMLAPLAPAAKRYTLRCIGHAHIDMNWMWGYDETVAITLDTLRTMLDLMREDSDFTFAQSQASVYRIVERHAPEMLAEIRQRVHEGRWEVTAATWVEADRNMPSQESVARHLLYTKRYLSGLLGIDPASLDLDFEPDTFGHSAHVPELLQDGGVRYYYHCRGAREHELYNWRSPSGSTLLAYREPSWYNWAIDGRCALAAPAFCHRHGMDEMLRVYGVGDHGGGPTRRDIERIRDMDTWPIFPHYRFGTYHDFYHLAETRRDGFPLVTGERNAVFDGCYTTQTRQKKGNRRCESMLMEAEAAAAMAHVALDRPYDAPSLRAAWEKVLFNQFHDILPGSGTVDTREYAMGLYQEALATAGTIRTASLRALGAAMDTRSLAAPDEMEPDGSVRDGGRSEGAGVGFGIAEGMVSQTGRHAGLRRAFMLSNPLPFDREETVALTVWDWDGAGGRMYWTDAEGRELPHQVMQTGTHPYWGHRHADVLLRARVPAMGTAVVALDEKEPDGFGVNLLDPRVDEPFCGVMENRFLRVEVDGRNGTLRALRDLRTGVDHVGEAGAIGLFRLVEEHTNRGMSAWWIGGYGDITVLSQGVRILRAEVGAGLLRQQITWEKRFGNGSCLTVTLSLDRDEPLVRIDAKVRWQEIGREGVCHPQLQFLLPMTPPEAGYLYDVPMGTVIRRAADMDMPAQSYACAAGNGALMLLAEAKHGFRGCAEGLSLTLIRSSVDPDPWPEVGEHAIRMALALPVGEGDAACGAGIWCEGADALRLSQAFHHPLQSFSVGFHDGVLPGNGALLRLTGEVVLSAVKLAEDGDGIIVRWYEPGGCEVEAALSFLAAPESAQRVNLLEQPVDGDVRLEGNTVRFTCRPHGIGSLRVRFPGRPA